MQNTMVLEEKGEGVEFAGENDRNAQNIPIQFEKYYLPWPGRGEKKR